MEFTVLLEQFEGPLDLMLHLISKNKLDLFDLDLDVLASQYCAFISQYKDQLELASEYMVEFSSLLEYKSRKLLPKKEAELEENYEEDQRDKLVNRLLEYQKYKEAAASLKEWADFRSERIARDPSSLIEEWSVPRNDDILPEMSFYEISKAMKRVLKRYALLQPYETSVSVRELSVETRMEQIEKRLPFLKQPCSFESLCADTSTLHEVIVTFLALLEMIHTGKCTYTIDNEDGIWINMN